MRTLLALVVVLALAAVMFVVLRTEPTEPVVAPLSTVVESRIEADRPDALVEPRDAPRDAPRAAIEAPQPVLAVAAGNTAPRLHGTVSLAPGRKESVDDLAIAITDLLGVERTTHAGATGSYAFDELEPGRYWLRVRAPEVGSADAVVDVRGDTRHDFVLDPPRVLLVRVVDEAGKPTSVIALAAVATSEPPGEWCDDVRGPWTNPVGLGRFEPPIRQPSDAPTEVIGRLHLDRDPPLHVSLVKFQRVLATQRVERGALFVDFVLRSDEPGTQMGSLRLRVVDCATKAPLERAQVTEHSAAMRMGRGLAGVFQFPSLLPGTHTLHIRAAEHATAIRSVRIAPGEALDLGDVCLGPALWISGRIVDDTGAGGELEIRVDPSGPDGRTASASIGIFVRRSKPDGTFRVDGLEPGFHRLEVLSREQRDQVGSVAVFDVRNGSVEGAVLTVTSGVDLVVDPDGKHGDGARFAVIDEKGVRVRSRGVREPAPMRVRLAPGRYTVEFTSAREDPAPRTVPVELIRDPVVVTMR